ncbi:MAG: VOC family protein [Candidatus Paceibacterota bacterium]
MNILQSVRAFQAPFHISFFVSDLKEAIVFYNEKLGFDIIREYENARHFNCYGNQLVAHELEGYGATVFQRTVESDDFVVPHAGVILNEAHWIELADKLEKQDFDFIAKPHARFIGKSYEQKVMFLKDPSGNAFEFKCYKNFVPEEWQ